MKKGLFITFEGGEGSGKSTQIKAAAAFLRKSGWRVRFLREPGGTQVSEAIREIILNKKFTKMTPETELLLYLAARAQIVREKILPALRKGDCVLLDRYEDSTLAYQGFGRNIPIQTILRISEEVVRHQLKPRWTFLLDIDPKVGMKRGGRYDRMEKQSLAFHQKVRRGFLALAKMDKKRFVVLDSRKPKDQVAAKIREVLKRAS